MRRFARAVIRDRDVPALAITLAVLLYSVCILLLPVSDGARRAAERRFQLSGWTFGAWALFQPVPSMYNFENRWEVAAAPSSDRRAEDCTEAVSGYINHHIYNRILLPASRARLDRCAPARVTFTSTYRGTSVETTYLVRHDAAGGRGLRVTPER